MTRSIWRKRQKSSHLGISLSASYPRRSMKKELERYAPKSTSVHSFWTQLTGCLSYTHLKMMRGRCGLLASITSSSQRKKSRRLCLTTLRNSISKLRRQPTRQIALVKGWGQSSRKAWNLRNWFREQRW